MNKPKYFNTTQTGEMLGLTRQTVAEIAKKLGIEAEGLGLPGRACYYTMPQVRQIGRAVGVKPNAELVTSNVL